MANRRAYLPPSAEKIATCQPGCLHSLCSPFPAHLGGLGAFAHELTVELGINADEISTTAVARAWARASGWVETDDGWACPAHVEDL
jgi:hypothetical protein